MSGIQWFYVAEGRRRGPVDSDQLLVDLMKTSSPREALVWHKGLTAWTRVAELAELAGEMPPPIPIVTAIAAPGAVLPTPEARPSSQPPSDSAISFRTGKVAPSDRTRAAAPSGVGGWLALLTAGLLVLGPLLGAGRINADFMSAESQNPGLKAVVQWTNFKTATWSAFLGFAAISVYAGWGLARGRRWSVVRRAKIGLWIAGPLSNVVLGVVVPVATLGSTPGFDSDQIVVPFMGAFLASAIAATVWTAYLSKSRRVRATYSNVTNRAGA